MLALSDFNVNAILGIMVSMTIIIALVFDFLFLPSMMILLAGFIHPKPTPGQVAAPHTETESGADGKARDQTQGIPSEVA